MFNFNFYRILDVLFRIFYDILSYLGVSKVITFLLTLATSYLIEQLREEFQHKKGKRIVHIYSKS